MDWKFYCLGIGKASVTMKKLLIQHRLAGYGIIAASLFGFGMIAGYYSGSLVYTDLFRQQIVTLTYGDQDVKVARDTFQKLASQLPKRAVNNEKDEHEVWTVPASLSVMHYIRKSEYLSGDDSSELEPLWAIFKEIL